MIPRILQRLGAAVAFLSIICSVSAEGEAVPGELTEEQISRAVSFVCSSDKNLRTGAYAAGRGLGEEGKETYRQILEKAEGYYLQRLNAAADLVRTRGASFDTAVAKLIELRAETMTFLRTDHKKSPQKIAELDQKFAGVEGAQKNLLDEIEKAGGTAMVEPIGILGEIWVELAWCDGKTVSMREIVLKKEREVVSKDLQDRVMLMMELEGKSQMLERVNEFNAGLSWASPTQKSFGKIINEARFVMGLVPLRLDERLSEAAKGHSEEMKRLRYFSHDSPVAENRSPSMRVRNAEFQGAFRGENIFFKSNGAVPGEAYRAWWASDGHRFIMFGAGPNTLGVGISSGTSHWTMLTGNKRG